MQPGTMITHWQTVYHLQGGHRSPPLCMAVRRRSSSGLFCWSVQPVAPHQQAPSAANESLVSASDCLQASAKSSVLTSASHDHILIGDRSGHLHYVSVQHQLSAAAAPSSQAASHCQHRSAPPRDLSPDMRPGWSASELGHEVLGTECHGTASAWQAHDASPIVAVSWGPSLGPGVVLSAALGGTIRLWNLRPAEDGSLQVGSFHSQQRVSECEITCCSKYMHPFKCPYFPILWSHGALSQASL